MLVNGTLMNYYFHCKRQCYLCGNRLNLEDNSEQVKIGKAMHEEKASEGKNTEISIDNIRLDKLTKEYLTEIKKSDADVEAARWQLLYYLTIAVIYQTHLDQRISFLHEPSEGRFSLSLDLSEVFKPVIVFRTIFDLVNNRRLQVEKHFEKKVNYCILNEEGRKIFIEAFENRLESVFLHPKLKRKVSYRTALKLDCYKLIKNILEGKEFVPFSLKEGM